MKHKKQNNCGRGIPGLDYVGKDRSPAESCDDVVTSSSPACVDSTTDDGLRSTGTTPTSSGVSQDRDVDTPQTDSDNLKRKKSYDNSLFPTSEVSSFDNQKTVPEITRLDHKEDSKDFIVPTKTPDCSLDGEGQAKKKHKSSYTTETKYYGDAANSIKDTLMQMKNISASSDYVADKHINTNSASSYHDQNAWLNQQQSTGKYKNDCAKYNQQMQQLDNAPIYAQQQQQQQHQQQQRMNYYNYLSNQQSTVPFYSGQMNGYQYQQNSQHNPQQPPQISPQQPSQSYTAGRYDNASGYPGNENQETYGTQSYSSQQNMNLVQQQNYYNANRGTGNNYQSYNGYGYSNQTGYRKNDGRYISSEESTMNRPMSDNSGCGVVAMSTACVSNQLPSNQLPSNQLPSNQLPSNQLPNNQPSGCQVSGNQLAVSQLPNTQLPGNQVPNNRSHDNYNYQQYNAQAYVGTHTPAMQGAPDFNCSGSPQQYYNLE